jgi:putative ABC transport system permease protein
MIMLITLIFNLIAAIILTIAAINIMHTFSMLVLERRRELAVMRAVGATRRAIRSLVLVEAAILGSIGGTAGLIMGWSATSLVDHLFTQYVPDFPFKPTSLFAFAPWMAVAGLIVAVTFCLLGAALPSLKASRTDPAEALAGR